MKKQYRACVLCPWQLPKVKGSFELFVNASSFQEMEPEVLDNYISYINKLVTGHLLLKNSVVGKRPATNENDVGVQKTIKREDYLRAFSHFELIASNAKAFGHVYKNFVADVMILKKRKDS